MVGIERYSRGEHGRVHKINLNEMQVLEKKIPFQNEIKKGLFLYSALSSLLDCSKRFTLHP